MRYLPFFNDDLASYGEGGEANTVGLCEEIVEGGLREEAMDERNLVLPSGPSLKDMRLM